jgi:hypothetical protein
MAHIVVAKFVTEIDQYEAFSITIPIIGSSTCWRGFANHNVVLPHVSVIRY